MNKIDILKSIRKTVNENIYVRINTDKLNDLAKYFSNIKFTMPLFNAPESLETEEDIVQYFFLLDSLNFKFWHDDRSDYNYKGKTDSPALESAICDNLWIITAKEMASINNLRMMCIFHNIPMINERKKIITDNGKVLLKKYEGKAINILEEGNFEIPKVLDLLKEVDSFCDIYKNHIFMKRAQLFLAMVHSRLNNLRDIEELTVYADYQIPKFLEHFGVFKYNEELKRKIENSEDIFSESEEELAIRSCTIEVGELLSNKLNIPNAYLDYPLWKSGKELTKKHHYTKTIWY